MTAPISHLPLSLCVVGLLFTASLPAQNPTEEAAIREIVRKYVDAREQIDPQAIQALFTPDADQLVSSGEWRKGREELVKGTVRSSQNASGKRTIRIQSVRFLTPNVAIADGPYEIEGSAQSSTRKMWTCLVLAKGAEGWRITAIRNMLPAPPAR